MGCFLRYTYKEWLATATLSIYTFDNLSEIQCDKPQKNYTFIYLTNCYTLLQYWYQPVFVNWLHLGLVLHGFNMIHNFCMWRGRSLWKWPMTQVRNLTCTQMHKSSLIHSFSHTCTDIHRGAVPSPPPSLCPPPSPSILIHTPTLCWIHDLHLPSNSKSKADHLFCQLLHTQMCIMYAHMILSACIRYM